MTKKRKLPDFILYEIYGFRLLVNCDDYPDLDDNTVYYAVLGEFLYKQQLLDGELLMPVAEVHGLIQQHHFILRGADSQNLYAQALTEEDRKNIMRIPVKVKHLTSWYVDEDGEPEEYGVFLKISG